MKISEETKGFTSTHSMVRIPFEDLVEKLAKLEGSGAVISAQSNGYDFSDVNDIREHPETFQGSPKLKIDDVNVWFSSQSTTFISIMKKLQEKRLQLRKIFLTF